MIYLHQSSIGWMVRQGFAYHNSQVSQWNLPANQPTGALFRNSLFLHPYGVIGAEGYRQGAKEPAQWNDVLTAAGTT